MDLTDLVTQCAPMVAAGTMQALVLAESSGDPYTIRDNTAHKVVRYERKKPAVEALRTLMREGHQVDVGLAQLSNYAIDAYDLAPGQALDPCTNIEVGGRILHGNYQRALKRWPDKQQALRRALAAYNTGEFHLDLRIWVNSN